VTRMEALVKGLRALLLFRWSLCKCGYWQPRFEADLELSQALRSR